MQKNRKLLSVITACLFVCLCLTGCDSQQQAAQQADTNQQTDTYTFTDALNQEITIQNPQRVVALMGSFAEIWCLAGGQDTLVGVTSDAFDGRDLGLSDEIAVVGTFQNPNIEEILALEPDLVLLSAETKGTDSHVALKDALTSAGVTAAYFSVTHFEDYLAMLKICTEITGDETAYQTNGEAVEQQIAQVINDNKLETQPSILLMITYSGGIRPQSSSSMTGKILADLGCHNIVDDNPSLLKDFSVENIIETDPDYIFVIPMGNDDNAAVKNLQENVESNPAWSSLTAVQTNRYILLPKEKFLYKPNARWADSYSYLADLLHA